MKFLPAVKIPVKFSKLAVKVGRISPELCIGLGIGCFVAATVSGCRVTATKAHKVLDRHEEMLEEVKTVKESDEFSEEEYSEKDYRKDLCIVYGKTTLGFVKAYAPTIALTGLGTAFILTAYKILKTRNLALIAAYTGLQRAFEAYRSRVLSEDDGFEKDLYYRTGLKQEKIETTVVDEKGKEKKKNEIVDMFDGRYQYSQYARFFDESSKQWQNSQEYNLTYLLHQQSYANDRLHAVGHVFLNEIYDMLGFPHTQAGAVVGWVDGNGDGYIDFGIHEGRIESREFVNGWKNTILLDFNVDGIIVDKI